MYLAYYVKVDNDKRRRSGISYKFFLSKARAEAWLEKETKEWEDSFWCEITEQEIIEVPNPGGPESYIFDKEAREDKDKDVGHIDIPDGKRWDIWDS